ncbi:MAG: hydroxymethylpyrimidine/phosphomethylpyrimidine kinase [Flammeovirgaceae bacterium]
MRPYVLSIAGFDPSSGAGITSDVKTFEALQVYGLSVCTALTIQTDRTFLNVNWLEADQIIDQLAPLLETFPIAYCKIGLIKNWETLSEVIDYLKHTHSGIQLILDPILKASAGFDFEHEQLGNYTSKILKRLALLTPNYHEALQITQEHDAEYACAWLSKHCPTLLKGGHHPDELGHDYLYQQEAVHVFKPTHDDVSEKHGSGCVLSAAITAYLALGNDLISACSKAKAYTTNFLASNSTLLGYHSV